MFELSLIIFIFYLLFIGEDNYLKKPIYLGWFGLIFQLDCH